MGLMLRGVSKSFGSFQALKDLSMEVREGALFGFLGANAHGLRNELTGSEHVSKNDLLEGKETPISQQGDLHDKYRRFLGAYPYLC